LSLIIGIDPSLTSTGIVVLRNGQVETAVTTKNRPELGTIERVTDIRLQIGKILSNLTNDEETQWQAPDLIVIEGFSYGSKGRSVFDIAYLGWRIREDLEWHREYEKTVWIEVPPTQLKKFATGKGNANKEIILQQVYKRWGVEFSDNNQADAYVLSKIGEAYMGWSTPGYTFPDFQREVIANLKGESPMKPPKKKSKKLIDE
jgi:crossover junction endodeoxyribonuclease RuvC